MIYLARASGTVPVLPPFTSHIEGEKPPLPFSRVFDVPRMSRALDTPLLDWAEVKDLDRAWAAEAQDTLGCWNIWQVQSVHADGPRGSYTSVLLGLGMWFWILHDPLWVR